MESIAPSVFNRLIAADQLTKHQVIISELRRLFPDCRLVALFASYALLEDKENNLCRVRFSYDPAQRKVAIRGMEKMGKIPSYNNIFSITERIYKLIEAAANYQSDYHVQLATLIGTLRHLRLNDKLSQDFEAITPLVEFCTGLSEWTEHIPVRLQVSQADLIGKPDKPDKKVIISGINRFADFLSSIRSEMAEMDASHSTLKPSIIESFMSDCFQLRDILLSLKDILRQKEIDVSEEALTFASSLINSLWKSFRAFAKFVTKQMEVVK